MSAATRSLFAVAIMILTAGAVSIESAERSKDCDNPPGGRITCEDNQAAICKVKAGKVEGYCTTPRKGATENEVKAQLLTLILEKPVSAADIERKDFMGNFYALMIIEGRAVKQDMVVTFSLPDLSAYVEGPAIRPPKVKKPPQTAVPSDKPKPGVPRVIVKPN